MTRRRIWLYLTIAVTHHLPPRGTHCKTHKATFVFEIAMWGSLYYFCGLYLFCKEVNKEGDATFALIVEVLCQCLRTTYVFGKEYCEDEEENEMPVLPYQTICCHPSPPLAGLHTAKHTHAVFQCVFSFFGIVSLSRKTEFFRHLSLKLESRENCFLLPPQPGSWLGC